MFPLTAKSEDAFIAGQVSAIQGHIAAPARLLVALQLSTGSADVSFVAARRYLSQPEQRAEIERTLTTENGLAFLESLGDVAASFEESGVADLQGLCISISRLVDVWGTAAAAASHVRPDFAAVRAIGSLIQTVAPSERPRIAQAIVQDDSSLSIAMHVTMTSSLEGNIEGALQYPAEKVKELRTEFARNCLKAARNGALLSACAAPIILQKLPTFANDQCPAVFKALRDVDASLDSFALCILRENFDSYKGQIYAIGSEADVITTYVPIDELRRHAVVRLSDQSLGLPARAAWKALVEGRRIYGKDGSSADD